MVNKMMYIAFGEYFKNPPSSWLIKPWGVTTTGRARNIGNSLKLSYEGLKKGFNVCIFPKGGRTAIGDIMNPKSGAGILLIESNTPIVPILIDGALNTMSYMQPKVNFLKYGLSWVTLSIHLQVMRSQNNYIRMLLITGKTKLWNCKRVDYK